MIKKTEEEKVELEAWKEHLLEILEEKKSELDVLIYVHSTCFENLIYK